ncbi:MAG: DUF1648 domain-containing protein [Lachnospiraceae bacterium]|nr:DUF1648 domain-containing protein [Lachnospiraceae bacterium]
MEKRKTKKIKLLWIITFVPLIITAAVIPFMRDKVPMHYDFNGNIDRWGSKYENFIFPVIIIILSLLWQCTINHFKKKQSQDLPDKAKKEAAVNEKVLYITATAMTAMFCIIQCAILFSSCKVSGNSVKLTPVFYKITNISSGIFIMIIANFIPLAKRNSVLGLRTAWSMENDQTWLASNRFCGKLLFIAGIAIIIETLFIEGLTSVLVMTGIIIAASIICVIYSYYSYKKYK